MKLRLKHHLYLSILLLLAYWLIASQFTSISAIFQTIIALGYACISALILSVLWRIIYCYGLQSYWSMECMSNEGEVYPCRKIRVTDHRDGSERSMLLAGIWGELQEYDCPAFYGMPSHIDYLVNIEDLAFMSDEEIIEYISDQYDAYIGVVEK